MNAPVAPPGWYPSPTHAGNIQYWDGTAWSEESYPTAATPPDPYSATGGTSGFAIASMVLGILWLYWIGSILALIFGYLALKQIREQARGGQGMAIAGIVLGWIGVAFLTLVLIVGISTGFSGAQTG